MAGKALGGLLIATTVTGAVVLAPGAPTAVAKNGDTHITGAGITQTIDCNDATLIVNVVGCFVMGALAEWLALHDTGVSQNVKLFLATGILGGFTTFSAFALDTAVLWQRGTTGTAALYVLASFVLSIGGLFAGMALLRAA